MVLLSSFWYSFGLVCDTLFSYHFILSINVNVLASLTGKNNFVVCDPSLQGLTKRPDRFETIKLYRMQVS